MSSSQKATEIEKTVISPVSQKGKITETPRLLNFYLMSLFFLHCTLFKKKRYFFSFFSLNRGVILKLYFHTIMMIILPLTTYYYTSNHYFEGIIFEFPFLNFI